MTKEAAIQFLEANQPLPPDSKLSQTVIDRFDEVRLYFLETPDPICVPLLLNAFGDGDGFGVYQLVEDVLLRQNRDQVIRNLLVSLESNYRGVRYWSSQIAANFPDEALVPALVRLLDEDDFDMKYAALTALEQTKALSSREAIMTFAVEESDEELKELAEEILARTDPSSGQT